MILGALSTCEKAIVKAEDTSPRKWPLWWHGRRILWASECIFCVKVHVCVYGVNCTNSLWWRGSWVHWRKGKKASVAENTGCEGIKVNLVDNGWYRGGHWAARVVRRPSRGYGCWHVGGREANMWVLRVAAESPHPGPTSCKNHFPVCPCTPMMTLTSPSDPRYSLSFSNLFRGRFCPEVF